MQSLALGPFALSVDRLLILLAVLVALFAGWASSRQRGRNPDSALLTLLLVSVLAARLGFVVRFSDDYLARPLQIIDLRDGGFWWPAGLAIATLGALLYLWRQPALRRPLSIALVSGALVWTSTALPLRLIEQQTQALPDLTLTTPDGDPVNLQQFAGRPIVLNVWASWCPPCVREMPVLAQAQRRYPQVQFLFANLGEDATTVTAFLLERELELDAVLLDLHNRIGQHYGSQAVPTTLFIDANGRLRDSHLGELSSASLQHRLASILPDQLPQ